MTKRGSVVGDLLAIFVAAVVCAVLFSDEARGQTTVPIDAKEAKRGERCMPGFGVGEQWPGSSFNYGTRTDNGWFAYAFCKAPDGKPIFFLRVCAHGECLPQTTYWQNVGQLIVGSVNVKPRIQVADDYIAANPVAYRCRIFPTGAQPPENYAAPAPQFPAAGTLRAGICDDALNAMRAVWPTAAGTTPPPPPPPPQPGWTAYGGTIFKHAAGKLTVVVSRKTAVKGAPCVGVTVATAGTFTYQQIVGGPLDEATRCMKP